MTHRRVCTECNGLGRVPLVRGFLNGKVCRQCEGLGVYRMYPLPASLLGHLR